MPASGGPLLCVVVIAYEAESTIDSVLDRLPELVAGHRPLVLVADDCSRDRTAERAETWGRTHPDVDLVVVRRPTNLGYGGNQLASYAWAAERGAEAVVLVHGDGQYPPERVPDMLAPIVEGHADVVLGSRMVEPRAALAGGMPWRRYVGNRVLTRVLNIAGRAELTEWFSGLRAYRVANIAALGFDTLPSGFEIDTAITFRLLDAGARFAEISIPTRYGDEISRVPLLRTGALALRHGWESRRWRASLRRRLGRGTVSEDPDVS